MKESVPNNFGQYGILYKEKVKTLKPGVNLVNLSELKCDHLRRSVIIYVSEVTSLAAETLGLQTGIEYNGSIFKLLNSLKDDKDIYLL